MLKWLNSYDIEHCLSHLRPSSLEGKRMLATIGISMKLFV